MDFNNKRIKLSPIFEDIKLQNCHHCNDKLHVNFSNGEYCYKCKYVCSHCNERVGWVDIKEHICMFCRGCNCSNCIDYIQSL